MKFEIAIQLLKEFHYEKNGKKETIEFLEFILRKLKESENNAEDK